MELFSEITSRFAFFTAGLSLLMAVDKISQRRTDRGDLPLFLLGIVNAVLIFGLTAVFLDLPYKYPATIYLFIPAMFLIGPANFLYFRALVDPPSKGYYRLTSQLAVGFVAIIGDTILHVGFPEQIGPLVHGVLSDPLSHPLTILIAAAAVHLMSYFLVLLRIELDAIKLEGMGAELRFMIGWTVLALITLGLLFVGFLTGYKVLYGIGCIVLSSMLIFFFLARNRYMEFFHNFKIEYQKERYEKSLLNGVNTGLIRERLTELMNADGLYKDYDISMKFVAEKLSISAPQLSQFLNETIGLDFRNYVNGFRIDEAKQRLVNEPEATILHICYNVGFKSKSAFNEAFRKTVKMSPTEYREKHTPTGG